MSNTVMLIKICGITNINDAKLALEAGADWIGLNLVAGPRKIDFQTASQIVQTLDDPSQVVLLYLVKDDKIDPDVLKEFSNLGIRILQLYGQVGTKVIHQCKLAGLETIYVQPLENGQSLEALNIFLDQCGEIRPDYVLFDAASGDQLGGTGRQVDWKVLENARSSGDFNRWPPVLLAGGINPDNVREAIRLVQPAGIDVSSGVESSPGIKDPSKIKRLIDMLSSGSENDANQS